jgi:hypothetical protein
VTLPNILASSSVSMQLLRWTKRHALWGIVPNVKQTNDRFEITDRIDDKGIRIDEICQSKFILEVRMVR